MVVVENDTPKDALDQYHLVNGGSNSPISDQKNQTVENHHQQQQQQQQQKITPTPPSPPVAVEMNGGNHQKMGLNLMQQHNMKGNAFSNHQMVVVNHISTNNHHHLVNEEEGFKKEMWDLEEMLSKLNPMAEEFVPNHRIMLPPAGHFGYPANNSVGFNNGNFPRRRKNSFKRRNTRTSMAQQEDVIRRTVYVSDIDHQVTEEQLAAMFINCGQVVDCRVCGDPNSVLRFAFVEFTDEEGARNALSLAGIVLGYYPVRVLPSKTAIAPVNPIFLPRSQDEREMCARTIYCTNIDKKITQADVKLFFASFCGEVLRLRLLGDYYHSTRIAFVEFVMAESAIAALNCSGAVLGSLPIRVSPSKTPVRPRAPRSPMH